jgi:hypothetical protein
MTLLVALLLAQAHPCVEDARKLCPGMHAGEGRLAACLEQHKDQVSAACNAQRAEFKEDVEACRADAAKLCPGVAPGPAHMQCMRAHEDQLSPECKQLAGHIREGHKQQMRAARAACEPDVEKFCAQVKPGEGRVIACLKEHQSDLSAACASQMSH